MNNNLSYLLTASEEDARTAVLVPAHHSLPALLAMAAEHPVADVAALFHPGMKKKKKKKVKEMVPLEEGSWSA